MTTSTALPSLKIFAVHASRVNSLTHALSVRSNNIVEVASLESTSLSVSVAGKITPRATMKETVNGLVSRRKVGATVDSSVPLQKLLETAREAADQGSQVILEAVDKPRNVSYKGVTDLVTEYSPLTSLKGTDKEAEAAVLAVLRAKFPSHLILGEEGGVSGDPDSDYLWCVDPLDGTTNFTHGYPCFATSVAVLYRGKPAAACVARAPLLTPNSKLWLCTQRCSPAVPSLLTVVQVEFSGGTGHWIRRFYTATAGGGAFSDGKPIHVSLNDKLERSLLVTGFGYEHDEAWSANLELFKHFTDTTRGVRRLGAAAVDLCHVALGIVEGYWEFRLKPWDVAAGLLIAEEAGGVVSRMDGGAPSVFDRSVLVASAAMHPQIVEVTRPATEKLIADGFDLSPWFKPEGYRCS